MASWMVHLRIADKLLDELRDIDETAFVMGNIAPDSGVPNEDWTKFTPPKTVSHFNDGRYNASINIDEFCSKYFNQEINQKYNKKQYSFFLGYYVHLLSDIEWSKFVYNPLIQAYPKEASEDEYKLVWTAKKDWYDIDFLYLKQHPDFRAFSIYENAVNFENEFMDIFAKDAFENRRQYICWFYRNDERGELEREYKYLTPEQAEDFVQKTVEKIQKNVTNVYLSETDCIDFSNPVIQKKVLELKQIAASDLDYIKKAYEFVRDEIPHSWDIKVQTVSRKASEVLINKTGICWTKSCLLAALLRANGIPSGISYQLLTRADEDASQGYIIHALNTVYIKEIDKWIRLDARGNKENVNAQFSLEEEKLAFPVRSEYDEKDYRDNNPDLDARLVKILNEAKNIMDVTTDFTMKV